MGSTARIPSSEPSEEDEKKVKLGDLLAGRLSDLDVDSVEAVREARERE